MEENNEHNKANTTQEGNNPVPGSDNDPQKSPDNPFIDTFQTTKTEPPKKPGFLGKITRAAVATLAIGTTAGVARAQTSEDGLKTLNSDAHRIIDTVKDSSSDLVEKLSEPKLETHVPIAAAEPTPESTTKPQGSVGEEATSAEPDLTPLNTIFDTFVGDLKQIPAARMLGMQDAGVEGYKIAIGDETIKFMRKQSESHPDLDEITVEIASDDEIRIYTILGNAIGYKHKFTKPEKANEPSPPLNSSTGEALTAELKGLYKTWAEQRGKDGEKVTSSDEAIPPENQQIVEPSPTNTPEPTATNTISPTPRATQPPYIPDLGSNDGGIQETSIQQTENQPAEVQSAQPAPTDSTTPKSDL